jgi:hypothetical protein
VADNPALAAAGEVLPVYLLDESRTSCSFTSPSCPARLTIRRPVALVAPTTRTFGLSSWFAFMELGGTKTAPESDRVDTQPAEAIEPLSGALATDHKVPYADDKSSLLPIYGP